MKTDQLLDSQAQFTQTDWYLVEQASSLSDSEAASALERLCEVYWPPVYAFLRRSGYRPDDAEDLTQEFFTRFLLQGSLHHATPARGRFRCYLLGALKHFLTDDFKHRTRQRRGGGQQVFSLDDKDAERLYMNLSCNALPPDKAYDYTWAITFLEQCMVRLSAEYAAAGKTEVFDALRGFLRGDPDKGEYALLAQKLDLSQGALAVTICRMRKRFQHVVRLEASRTLPRLADLQAELRDLASLFS